MSVGRPGGRPLPSTVDRAVDRNVHVHVVHAGRPGDRPAFSTGRPGGRPGAQSGLLQCVISRSLIFDLCANFLYSIISSLPQFSTSVKIFQILADLQRTSVYHLAKSTHDLGLLGLESVASAIQLECTTHVFPTLHLRRTFIYAEHQTCLQLSNYMTSRRTHHEPTLTLKLTSSI